MQLFLLLISSYIDASSFCETAFFTRRGCGEWTSVNTYFRTIALFFLNRHTHTIFNTHAIVSRVWIKISLCFREECNEKKNLFSTQILDTTLITRTQSSRDSINKYWHWKKRILDRIRRRTKLWISTSNEKLQAGFFQPCPVYVCLSVFYILCAFLLRGRELYLLRFTSVFNLTVMFVVL